MKKLKESKFLINYSLEDKLQEFSRFYFRINSNTEISLHFKKSNINHVGLHINDFSTKSTDINISNFNSFLELFKLLSGEVFDINFL